mgnify:CR=1 FL=1
MSKRRLNKQQQRRIQKIQQKFQQDDLHNAETGLVLTRFGKSAEIEDTSGIRRHCSIRPNIDSLVAGDKVSWLTEGEEEGVVVSRHERHSALVRHSKQGVGKIVAANVTQMLIMFAPIPELSFYLIDSYLAAAEYLNLKPILLLNKTDLVCDSLIKELKTIYNPLQYPLFLLRRDQKQTLDELKVSLQNETNIIVGQSGVGKSSLVARLLPEEENIQTSEISTIAKLGKHTTSNSRYYHLPGGGALIDSPGVRDFHPGPLEKNILTGSFKELTPIIGQCRFRDCDHQSSPGCAIIEALEQQKIHPQRYASFCKMLQMR